MYVLTVKVTQYKKTQIIHTVRVAIDMNNLQHGEKFRHTAAGGAVEFLNLLYELSPALTAAHISFVFNSVSQYTLQVF